MCWTLLNQLWFLVLLGLSILVLNRVLYWYSIKINTPARYCGSATLVSILKTCLLWTCWASCSKLSTVRSSALDYSLFALTKIKSLETIILLAWYFFVRVDVLTIQSLLVVNSLFSCISSRLWIWNQLKRLACRGCFKRLQRRLIEHLLLHILSLT